MSSYSNYVFHQPLAKSSDKRSLWCNKHKKNHQLRLCRLKSFDGGFFLKQQKEKKKHPRRQWRTMHSFISLCYGVCVCQSKGASCKRTQNICRLWERGSLMAYAASFTEGGIPHRYGGSGAERLMYCAAAFTAHSLSTTKLSAGVYLHSLKRRYTKSFLSAHLCVCVCVTCRDDVWHRNTRLQGSRGFNERVPLQNVIQLWRL